MIKIIEEEKEEFIRQVNEEEKKGFLPVPQTHNVIEYGGKITYSVVLTNQKGEFPG